MAATERAIESNTEGPQAATLSSDVQGSAASCAGVPASNGALRLANPQTLTGRRAKSRAKSGRLKVCLAASPGGHLSELEALAECLDVEDRFLVTIDTPQARSAFPAIRKHYVRKIERNPIYFLLNAAAALRVLASERPDVVVSTGAGDSVPLIFLAACFGIPSVFAESVARVAGPSLTGRMVRRWVDLTIIPWPSLSASYPDGVLVAPMISPRKDCKPLPASPSIILLTGTGPRGFDRLVRSVDQLVGDKRLKGRVFGQIGASIYTPKNFAFARYLPHEELLGKIASSDIVITHCGAQSIREALSGSKLTIVVPRQPRFGEVVYRSRADLARYLGSLGWVELVDDPAHIPEVITKSGLAAPTPLPSAAPSATDVMRAFVRGIRDLV